MALLFGKVIHVFKINIPRLDFFFPLFLLVQCKGGVKQVQHHCIPFACRTLNYITY
jgi:hypothetical protein